MISRAVRPMTRVALTSVKSSLPMPARSVTTLSKTLYEAKAQATGQGRNGKASLLEDGPFEVTLAMPKSLGGSGQGQNPEQLFAMGYAACFLSALNLSASQSKISLPANVVCKANVAIGPPASGSNPFALSVDLTITSDAKGGEEKSSLQKAVEKAHEICPYSNATRNNVPVNIKVE